MGKAGEREREIAVSMIKQYLKSSQHAGRVANTGTRIILQTFLSPRTCLIRISNQEKKVCTYLAPPICVEERECRVRAIMYYAYLQIDMHINAFMQKKRKKGDPSIYRERI